MKYLFLLLLVVSFGQLVYSQNPIEIDEQETRHGPVFGSLVIIGGGLVTNEIYERFVSLAGGQDKARLVVVTNASGDSVQYYNKVVENLRSRLGKERVSTFNLSTIEEANDEKNLDVLNKATGIYFSGGRQWRITDVYLNTLVHRAFFNVLKRGGVIAGSSAGASIQGSFLWRGDTSGYKVLVGDHTQGLGFLRNAVVDQHLLVRNRQFDLISLIKIAPQLIGIGLDESTAVVVQKDELEVIGSSVAAVYSSDPDRPFLFLHKGQIYNLEDRKIVKNKADKK